MAPQGASHGCARSGRRSRATSTRVDAEVRMRIRRPSEKASVSTVSDVDSTERARLFRRLIPAGGVGSASASSKAVRKLCPIANLQPAVDLFHVLAHRMDADREDLRDLDRRRPLRRKKRDLLLPRAQPLERVR